MNFFEQFRLLRPGWRDVLEIAVVSYAIYRLLLVLHRTRAMQILVGIVVMVVAFAVAQLLKLTMILNILTYVSSFAAIAFIVVFAPEIRGIIAQSGRSRVSRLFSSMGAIQVADQIAEAVERLARSGVGAIIAVEQERRLDEYIESGSALQAKVSADLLAAIFTPYSPLHDGAVIIRGDTIVAAGAILPLSQTALTDRSLGTRHRAALGLSEETDAIVITVSEETSTISVVVNGRLGRNFTAPEVREMLTGRSPRSVSDQMSVPTTA